MLIVPGSPWGSSKGTKEKQDLSNLSFKNIQWHQSRSLNILKKHQIFKNDFSASDKLENLKRICTKSSNSYIAQFLTNGWFVAILKDVNYTLSQVKRGCEFALRSFTVTHILDVFLTFLKGIGLGLG